MLMDTVSEPERVTPPEERTPVPETGLVRRPTLADRHASVSPLDLRQAKFSTAMRGFKCAEVTTLLEEAAAGYEEALRENERMRQEVSRLEGSLGQFRDLENSLKNTLLSAQKLADDMRENATQDAARIVREAEGRAELLMHKAQARVEDVEREIDGLRMKKREAEGSIESTISSLQSTLEFVRQQGRKDRADRERGDVVALMPRPVAATA